MAVSKWMVQSNVEAFGHYEGAKLTASKVPFALAYNMIFGRAPRKLTQAYNPTHRQLRGLNRTELCKPF